MPVTAVPLYKVSNYLAEQVNEASQQQKILLMPGDGAFG